MVRTRFDLGTKKVIIIETSHKVESYLKLLFLPEKCFQLQRKKKFKKHTP